MQSSSSPSLLFSSPREGSLVCSPIAFLSFPLIPSHSLFLSLFRVLFFPFLISPLSFIRFFPLPLLFFLFSLYFFYRLPSLARASPCFSAAACHAVGRTAARAIRPTRDDHAWASFDQSDWTASVPELAFPYTGNFVHDLSSAICTSSPVAPYLFFFFLLRISSPPLLSLLFRPFPRAAVNN